MGEGRDQDEESRGGRAREMGERGEMTREDERANEWAELYYMSVCDEETQMYVEQKRAHDDANTWSYVWDDVETKHYHYNEVTGAMSWEAPEALEPSNWKPRWLRDRGEYVYDNIKTGERDWPAPPSAPPPPPRVFEEEVGDDFDNDNTNDNTKVKVWRVPKYNLESEWSTTEEGSWGLIEDGNRVGSGGGGGSNEDGSFDESQSYGDETGTYGSYGEEGDQQYFDDDYGYDGGANGGA